MFTFPMFYLNISRSVSQVKLVFFVADGELQDFKEFHTNSELAFTLFHHHHITVINLTSLLAWFHSQDAEYRRFGMSLGVSSRCIQRTRLNVP